MVNTRIKGRRNENRAKAILEAQNYEVYQVKGSTKFNKNCDLFECWDLLALKRTGVISNVTEILFLQIKTNRKPSKEYREKLLKFADKFANSVKDKAGNEVNIHCQLWIYQDRHGFEKYEVYGDLKKIIEGENK